MSDVTFTSLILIFLGLGFLYEAKNQFFKQYRKDKESDSKIYPRKSP